MRVVKVTTVLVGAQEEDTCVEIYFREHFVLTSLSY